MLNLTWNIIILDSLLDDYIKYQAKEIKFFIDFQLLKLILKNGESNNIY